MSVRLSSSARQLKRSIEGEGVRVGSVSLTSKNHLRFQIELPNNSVRMLICSLTSSDRKSDKNVIARVRRWRDEAAA